MSTNAAQLLPDEELGIDTSGDLRPQLRERIDPSDPKEEEGDKLEFERLVAKGVFEEVEIEVMED